MNLSLVGCGCGPDTMTVQGRETVERADYLIGAPRILAMFPEDGKRRITASNPDEIAEAVAKVFRSDPAAAGRKPLRIEKREEEISTCVLLSGDSGFYSAARRLLPLLCGIPELRGREPEIIPGISSLQLFSAKIREAWQDWLLCSAHGTECDPVSLVCRGKSVFFLTGGKYGPAELCRELRDTGLGFLPAKAGENLGSREERILSGSVSELAEKSVAPLSVLLVGPAPRRQRRTPGLPDGSFLREEGIPMTKQIVRAAALALLGAGEEDVCWDIGCGTGSVGIELAMQCRQVWGVERDDRALSLAEKNRERFGAWNLRLKPGSAPEALEGLPAPNAVFIGGSGGNLQEILRKTTEANPSVRLCVSAVTLESLSLAVQSLRDLGIEPEISQVSVSRSRRAGSTTMMLAQNPVFLISGTLSP